jgi:hypothetical protein
MDTRDTVDSEQSEGDRQRWRSFARRIEDEWNDGPFDVAMNPLLLPYDPTEED